MSSVTGIHHFSGVACIAKGGGDVLLVSRPQLCLPRKVICCRAKIDSAPDGSLCSRQTPSLLAAEIEEARAVLTLFLKKKGLSNVVAARAVEYSDLFIDHLVSRLHSFYKSRHLIGRELTTLEIREVLLPYLELLHEEHGRTLVDVIANIPHQPIIERPVVPIPATRQFWTLDSKKLKAMLRVSEVGPSGSLPPHILYLLDIGLEPEQITLITRKFPAFAYYSLEGKIKPLIEFLLDLGVLKSDIPKLLVKRPALCGLSLSENLIPTMTYLETLGVDKTKWARMITHFPAVITSSRPKLEATVQFLYELGLSKESTGKLLTRWPCIVGYNVEHKLRPTANYFESLGADVTVLLRHCPQIMGLSIEANLKPVTEFFLENGFSVEEVGTMITKCGGLYSYSLKDNLVPKWEFYLTMDYSRQDLVKFPQYFGYSFKERIQPRYEAVKTSGIKLPLSQMLTLKDKVFELLLKKKIEKLQHCQLGEFSNSPDTTNGENLQRKVSPLDVVRETQGASLC